MPFQSSAGRNPFNYIAAEDFRCVRWSDGRLGVMAPGHIDPEVFLMVALPYLEHLFAEMPKFTESDVRHVHIRRGQRDPNRVYLARPADNRRNEAQAYTLALKRPAH